MSSQQLLYITILVASPYLESFVLHLIFEFDGLDQPFTSNIVSAQSYKRNIVHFVYEIELRNHWYIRVACAELRIILPSITQLIDMEETGQSQIGVRYIKGHYAKIRDYTPREPSKLRNVCHNERITNSKSTASRESTPNPIKRSIPKPVKKSASVPANERTTTHARESTVISVKESASIPVLKDLLTFWSTLSGNLPPLTHITYKKSSGKETKKKRSLFPLKREHVRRLNPFTNFG